MKTGKAKVPYSVKGLLREFHLIGNLHEKTVLLLSDSQCRQVKSVNGRHVFNKGGAMWEVLVANRALQRLTSGQESYRYLIINNGVNIAQRRKIWRWQWYELKTALYELKSVTGYPRVAISLPFPDASVPEVEFNSWVEDRVRHERLNAPQFQIFNAAGSSASVF